MGFYLNKVFFVKFLLLESSMEWNEFDKILKREDFDDICDKSTANMLTSTYKLANRTKKTFYYASGKNPMKDTLSLSLTREAVDSFRKAVPKSIGKIGPYYAARVSRNACISPCSLLLALVYVDRLAGCNPNYLKNASSSEIFLISMLVASKFMYDDGTDDEVYNDEWSASSHMDVKHLKKLEAQFLHALDWRALVTAQEFQQMLNYMEARVALRNGRERGWFTYTDLNSLLNSKSITENMFNICTLFVQSITLLTIVYCSILMVCIGTMLLTPPPPAPSTTAATSALDTKFISDHNNSQIDFYTSIKLVSDEPHPRNGHQCALSSSLENYHSGDDVNMPSEQTFIESTCKNCEQRQQEESQHHGVVNKSIATALADSAASDNDNNDVVVSRDHHHHHHHHHHPKQPVHSNHLLTTFKHHTPPIEPHRQRSIVT